MGIGRNIEGPESPQAITDHPIAVIIVLHHDDDVDLMLSAAPALSRSLAALVGIIDPNAAGERLPLVTLKHELQ